MVGWIWFITEQTEYRRSFVFCSKQDEVKKKQYFSHVKLILLVKHIPASQCFIKAIQLQFSCVFHFAFHVI